MFVHHNVVGLHVAVHHTVAVGVVQTVGHLNGHFQRVFHVEPLVGAQAFFQCLTLQQLHHDVGNVVQLANVVDGDNVGVGKGACRLSFTHESTDVFVVNAVFFF